MGYYSGNSLYTFATVLFFAAMIFSFWASAKVKKTYNKYSAKQNRSGITGAQAARAILDRNNLQYVPIAQTSGTLTDYYDPQSKRVVLGEHEYSTPSSVSVGVAAHECGHAIQYAHNYFPAKLRMAIVPITNFGSKLSWPVIIAGCLLGAIIPLAFNLVYIGIALFGLCVLFQLITLPTEFDASARALKCIKEYNILDGEDYNEAKEVLTAAALTYVAALATSLAQMLRLIAIYGNRKR